MVKNLPGSPKQSSTPNLRLIRGRANIHDNEEVSPIIKSTSNPFITELSSGLRPESTLECDYSQIPLNNSSPRPFKRHHKRSDGEIHSHESSDELTESEDQPQENLNNTSKQTHIPLYIIGFLLLLFLAVALGLFASNGDEPSKDYQEELQRKFNEFESQTKNQHEDFWASIKVAIKEIPVLKQPRTIVFLYEQKSQKTLNDVLNKVVKAASCFLSKSACNEAAAVHVTGASLNNSQIINDHGLIIVKYSKLLEQSGVMVVHNLEQVPGKAAQAFHSFCDDYNPIVQKALIVFTLKVDELPEGYPMKFLENLLLNLWSDIGKGDKFYPLFTRITGTVLTVRPE